MHFQETHDLISGDPFIEQLVEIRLFGLARVFQITEFIEHVKMAATNIA